MVNARSRLAGDPAEGEAALYAELDRLSIAHETREHEATFTVAESAGVKAALPGGHSKTLLVRDEARLFLIVALGSVRVNLKGVGRALGARGRLSFASLEVLLGTLGVAPGSVTPFALMADRERRIAEVVLDTNLLAHDPVWFHPLRNTASTAVSPDGLRAFVRAHAARTSERDVTAR